MEKTKGMEMRGRGEEKGEKRARKRVRGADKERSVKAKE